jgi:hypothetical protein
VKVEGCFGFNGTNGGMIYYRYGAVLQRQNSSIEKLPWAVSQESDKDRWKVSNNLQFFTMGGLQIVTIT